MPILLNGSSRGGVGSLIGGWAKGLDRPSGNPVGRYIQEVAARSTPLGLLGAAASEAKRFMGMPTGELAGEFAGGGVGATAYHGSPHLFDKFKKEAIGTGEGAQAYGHGLYLAENPDVAKGYHRALGKSDLIKDGQKISYQNMDTLTAGVAADIEKAGGNLDAVRATYAQWGDNPLAKQRLAKLEELGNVQAEKGGALYKTDIPDDHIDKMLDWDKPLSEQHPDVQKALSGLNLPDKPWNTGSKIYESLSGKTGFKNAQEQQQYATARLQELGIPGIKYLDGSSRTLKVPSYGQFIEAAGRGKLNKATGKALPGEELAKNPIDMGRINGYSEYDIQHFYSKRNDPQTGYERYIEDLKDSPTQGTRNFVIFDPNSIRILERNGTPTGARPWAEDAPVRYGEEQQNLGLLGYR